MSYLSIVDFIRQYYPQYYGIKEYPAAECVKIRRLKEEWGIFSNFASIPIVVNGVGFKSTEQLFQLMKFQDVEVLKKVYCSSSVKMTSKKWQKTHRRSDWGQIVLDAMKFCLVKKYEQSEEFRAALERSKGKYIVEDQTSFPKKNPDAWGVKLRGENFVGPNLLGQFLMELRETGTLQYQLPADALDFIEALRDIE